MDQRELASFLKVSYSAVTKWETGQNPIPAWVADKLLDRSGKFVLDGFSPEEVIAIQRRAASKGMSADDFIASLVKAVINVSIFVAILISLFHVTRSPRNWSAVALKQTVVAAVSWSSAQLNSITQK